MKLYSQLTRWLDNIMSALDREWTNDEFGIIIVAAAAAVSIAFLVGLIAIAYLHFSLLAGGI